MEKTTTTTSTTTTKMGPPSKLWFVGYHFKALITRSIFGWRMVHKWRHIILNYCWPSCPYFHAFSLRNVVTKSLTPQYRYVNYRRGLINLTVCLLRPIFSIWNYSKTTTDNLLIKILQTFQKILLTVCGMTNC